MRYVITNACVFFFFVKYKKQIYVVIAKLWATELLIITTMNESFILSVRRHNHIITNGGQRLLWMSSSVFRPNNTKRAIKKTCVYKQNIIRYCQIEAALSLHVEKPKGNQKQVSYFNKMMLFLEYVCWWFLAIFGSS